MSSRRKFLGRPSFAEHKFIADALRTETVGGVLLLIAAVVALIWANTGYAGYSDVRNQVVGAEFLGLDLKLTIGSWASDGLLAIFFFVAGIELKRELMVGELRNPAAAALPVVAAICGMAVPALFYFAVNAGGDMSGWAVPTATDIAFALAVLAVVGTNLPSALRAFLLSLAVVDDLGAILIIALFFGHGFEPVPLLIAAALLALFWFMQKKRVRGWYYYVPLALVIWALVHESGIHATVAGVAMGLLMRVVPDKDEDHSPAENVEHAIRPLSAGLAVPAFALMSAGVLVSVDSLGQMFREPTSLGIMAGLFLGKMVGIFGGSYLAVKFTKAELSDDLEWADVLGVSVLAGVGFTVSLLISELAFDDPGLEEHAKAAVLIGSLCSAVVAAVLLRMRNKKYRALWEAETRDSDGDGIPDCYMADAAREKAALEGHKPETNPFKDR